MRDYFFCLINGFKICELSVFILQLNVAQHLLHAVTYYVGALIYGHLLWDDKQLFLISPF